MSARIERIERGPQAGAPLVAALLDGTARFPGTAVGVELDAFTASEDRLDARARSELAASIARGLEPHAPPPAVRAAVDALGERGTACVVTGQQPGFLCAPLYNLYKALGALALARRLEERWGRRVVALFWNHADDHDVAEVHHAFVLNQNLDLQKIGLAGLASGRQPFSRIVLTEERQHLAALRELLATSLGGTELARAIELLLPREGETLAGAFTRSMTALLGQQGLVVVEPDWIRAPVSRALAALVRANLAGELAAGAGAVRAAGFEPAIDPADAALLFRVDDSGRRAIRFREGALRLDGEGAALEPEELARAIERDPAGFSPGALTRPVAQDLALPVAAYVGGEGELAYHAELGPLRVAAHAPATPFVLRTACTLVDAETDGALAKLGLALADVLAGKTVLAAPDDEAPPAVIAEIGELAARIQRDIEGLRAKLEPLDRGLAQSLKRTAFQARNLLQDVRDKAERVHQNKSGKGRRLVRRVENTLLPRGEPQERVLGPLGFVARFGTEWIDVLASAIDPFDRRHVVLHFEPEAKEPA